MNKRVLKNITLCILAAVFLCLSCVGFSGCYRGPFFKKEHLQEHLVPYLPKPKTLMWRYRGYEIKVKMTQDEFNDYVESVYEYLRSCNFERFGTRGEDNSSMFGVRYYVNVDVHELSDFYVTQHMASVDDYKIYVFVWANETSELSGDYGSWIAHYLELRYDKDTDGKMYMNLCRPIVPYDFRD